LKTILVCVTGAVSSVVVPSYIAQMRKHWGCDIQVLMSKSATKFVTPYALHLHSGKEVFTDSFQSSDDVLVPHIKLTKDSDVILVMPATANIISKAANGICDDLISTAILAANATTIFVPSMNANMWNKSILQANVSKLIKHGYHFVEPISGLEIQGLEQTNGVMPMLREIILAVEEIMEDFKINREFN
jgi:phosphopantothenoylcysteine decarboxylase